MMKVYTQHVSASYRTWGAPVFNRFRGGQGGLAAPVVPLNRRLREFLFVINGRPARIPRRRGLVSKLVFFRT